MICRKNRKSKDVFCSSDFVYEVEVKKRRHLVQASKSQTHPQEVILESFKTMCYLQKKGRPIVVGGEILNGVSYLEVICYNFNDATFLDIEKNPTSWFVVYKGTEYKIDHAEQINLNSIYVMLECTEYKNLRV
jgi:hypothetical protein